MMEFQQMGTHSNLYYRKRVNILSKKGRPKKDESRKCQCKIWLTEKEKEELDHICKLTNVTKSDFVRKALSSQITLAKYRIETM